MITTDLIGETMCALCRRYDETNNTSLVGTVELKQANTLVDLLKQQLVEVLNNAIPDFKGLEDLQIDHNKDPKLALLYAQTIAKSNFDATYANSLMHILAPSMMVSGTHEEIYWKIDVYEKHGLKDDTSKVPDLTKVFTIGVSCFNIWPNGEKMPLITKPILNIKLRNPIYS